MAKTFRYKDRDYAVYPLEHIPEPLKKVREEVFCVPMRYPDGTLAVQVMTASDTPRPFGTATANIAFTVDVPPKGERQAYLNTRGCRGWLLPFLLGNGLASSSLHVETVMYEWYMLFEFRTEKFFADGKEPDFSALETLAPPPPAPEPLPPVPDDIPEDIPLPTEEDLRPDFLQEQAILFPFEV